MKVVLRNTLEAPSVMSPSIDSATFNTLEYAMSMLLTGGEMDVRGGDKRLFLLRHAASELNVGRRLLSARDPGLSEAGRSQAGRVAATLAGACPSLDRIVASPMLRAVQTAELLAEQTGATVELDRRLVEMAFGDLEGKVLADLPDLHRTFLERPQDFVFPGAERPADVQRRVLELLEATDGRTLVVGHLFSLLFGLCGLLGLPLEVFSRFYLEPAGLVELVSSPGRGWQLAALWPHRQE